MVTGNYVIYKNNGYNVNVEQMLLKELVFDEENNLKYSGKEVTLKSLKGCRVATIQELRVNCKKEEKKEVVEAKPKAVKKNEPVDSDEKPVKRRSKSSK